MRICIIGYGNIARSHIEAFRAHGCEIVASCNRSERGNESARQEGGIPKTYTDHISMIETEKPDAVVNCVSFEHIFSITKSLIPFGIPLLIEKPAGLSVAETKELIDLRNEFGTKVQVAMNRRHYSIFQNAINEIGGQDKIEMINLEWSESPLKAKTKKGLNDLLIGKYIYANTIHGIDILDYFSGGISDFQVYCSSSIGYFNWQMILSGKSKSGILVNFTSSWGSPVPWRLVIYGSNKRAEFSPLETCRIYSDSEPKVLSISPKEFDTELKAGFYMQSKIFLDLINSNEGANTHGLESTLNGMLIAEGIYNELTLLINS
jgi:predicted dehydrogenase